MLIDPNIGESIQISGKTYIFSETAGAPGIIYAEIGRKAKVYRLMNGSQAFALKVFKSKYRSSDAVEQAQSFEKFRGLPGLAVAHRSVITAKEHEKIVKKHPDFEFSILMPWVEGRSWFNLIAGKTPINQRQSIRLACTLANVLHNLESHEIAHCDLSSSNFIFSTDFSEVELIDIEDMYSSELQEPSERPNGTGGYCPNWTKRSGFWESAADRFAAAILICEILGWQFENIREASDGDSFFAESEFGNKSKRFKLLSDRLEQIHPQLANLFRAVWYSESFEDCPKISQWKEILDSINNPEMVVSPLVVDFGKIEPHVNLPLPAKRIRIQNMGGGLLTGTITSNVPWLSVSPKEFACKAGMFSEHSISLLTNYPTNNTNASRHEKAIIIHDGKSSSFLSCNYTTSKRRSGALALAIVGGIVGVIIIIAIIVVGLVLALVMASHQAGGNPNSAPPTLVLPTEIPAVVTDPQVQAMPSYLAILDYSSNLEEWNVDYYKPVSINLSQARINADWIEPTAVGNQRFFGVLSFGTSTQVGVILDVLDQFESRMIFSFDEDADFSDNPVYKTSDEVLTEPVEFQVSYSDGSMETYAIYAYYLPDRAPGELLYYRGSLRMGTIQISNLEMPIAIFDDNADGSYSDLENIEVKIDINKDSFIDDGESFSGTSPIQIGSVYYRVAKIDQSGSTIILQEAQSGQIIGTIKDAISGEPIGNAKVTTYPLGITTTSNENGQFSIQVPEGNYWQLAIMASEYVPEYVYFQEAIVPGQPLEINASLSRPSDATSGTVRLYEGDSYHFLAGIMNQYVGGDFYFGFADGIPQFWANNYYQRGLVDLGFNPDIKLDRVTPPESGYYLFGVEAIAGHVYVSQAKEGETGHYIIFRVTKLEPGQFVEVEYYYH